MNKQVNLKLKAMKTTENNRLIAEFMGAEYCRHNENFDLYSTISLNHIFEGVDGGDINTKQFFTPDEMKFRTSWDWLMPVVERVDKLMPDDSMVQITYNRCVLDIPEYEVLWDVVENTRIEATYKLLVGFIKWDNDTKNQK